MITYGESGFADQVTSDNPEAGNTNDLIMHAELHSDGRKVLFGADVSPEMTITPGNDTAVSITGDSSILEDVQNYWRQLEEGAEVMMPLDSAPWGATFASFATSLAPFGCLTSKPNVTQTNLNGL